MSHTSAISAIKIVSIEALRAAIKELNDTGTACSLVENATPRAFYPGQEGMGKAEFVLKMANAPYDIGFYKQADNSYQARTDFWGQHIERQLGGKATTPERTEQAKMGRLFQLYGVHVTMEMARKKGHVVRRINDATTGKVKLELTGAL